MNTNMTIGKEATQGMLSGIKRATEAIRLTYGPKGVNAVVEQELYPYHMVANDAQTIIQAIEVEDPLEKRGLAFLKELSDKAHKDSGDGRKTTCILAEEILEAGFKSELTGLQLKEELDKLIPIIEQKIDEQKKTITEEEVEPVATIAAESKDIGQLIASIYKAIGKEGIIIPEGSGTYKTSYQIISGVRFADAGYLSPYMARDDEALKDGRTETKAIYKNPIILVTKKKIEKDQDIEKVANHCIKSNRALVIFTDDMDSNVAARMVATHRAKVLNILIIKAPVLWKNYVFEDFAKVTGSTIVEDASGVNWKNLDLPHLGTCEQITTDKDETIIIPSVDFSEHITNLKNNAAEDGNLLRLSWLQTKTAILKLGANSESELSYIRLKTEDAINSSRLALKDGVVIGGGVCLDEIALTGITNTTEVGKIIQKALMAPFEQNLKNMGKETQDWGDEVVDAASVVKNAVRNAIALAGTILTAGIVITLPPKKPEQNVKLPF